MFSTEMGSTADGAMKIYLRPETAQGIFVNYLNVQKTGRMKIPFGIAQIGKAFRNEIVARQFIFRMREFEQMEMQFFVSRVRNLTGSRPGRLPSEMAQGAGLRTTITVTTTTTTGSLRQCGYDIEFLMPSVQRSGRYPQPYKFRLVPT